MEITTAYITDKGAREINEDSVKVFSVGDVIIGIVSDGLGGHGSGDEASQLVVETIETCYQLHPEFSEENIRNILNAANQNVLNLHNADKHCKATVVAAFVRKDKIIIAHAGDSRCYVFGNKKIRYETRDHSVSQMAVDMGEISKKDIRNSDDRNKVLHSIGKDGVKIDIETIRSGLFPWRAILLCSDGFWQNVVEEEMIATLQESKNVQEWLDKMIEILYKKKDLKQDNYSAVALWNK